MGRRRKVELAELVREKWILHPAHEAPGLLVREAFQARGLELPRASVVTLSFHLREMLLLTGEYLTVIPASMLRVFNAKQSDSESAADRSGNSDEAGGLFTLKNRTLSPVVELFMKCVRAAVKSMALMSRRGQSACAPECFTAPPSAGSPRREIRELARAGEARVIPGFFESRDQLAIGEDPAQLGLQPRDDGLRGSSGGHNPVQPLTRTRESPTRQGRGIGEHRAALARGDREQPDLARADLRRGNGKRIEHEIHITGEQRGHRRGRAAEGNVHRVELFRST